MGETAIAIRPMIYKEARECADRINANMNNVRRDVVALHDRDGWEAEEARKLAEQIRRDEELAYQINAEKSGSQFVGTPGARQEFTLTLEKFLLFNTRFGNIHIYLMRDAAGNRIVYKGQWIGSEGETIIAKATIKEHAIYQGEKQTVIQRLNIK